MKKWTKEEKEKLKKDWINLDSKELIEIYGRSYGSLQSMAQSLNIKKQKNKHKLKKLLDRSNESMYWLGFIMADGHISKRGELSISLSEIDGIHLKKLAKYLDININYNSKSIICFNKKRKPIYKINCMDKIYGIEILKVFNIKKQKTYNEISLDFLKNKNEIISFLCGLIDGDGCFATNKHKNLSVIKIGCHISWLNVYEKIKKMIFNFDIESSIRIDNKGYMHFSITKQLEMLKLYNIAKELHIPLMERKWSKIKTIRHNRFRILPQA